MTRTRITMLALALTGMLAWGCTSTKPALHPFSPVDMDKKMSQGFFEPRVENFLVILDLSGSMEESYKDRQKFVIAVETVKNFVATLPDSGLDGGLRVFGWTLNPLAEKTRLVVPVAPLDKGAFYKVLDDVAWATGKSPVSRAIAQASDDLDACAGDIAVILVTDGKDTEGGAVRAVEVLSNTYRDRLCLHTVQVGDDPAASALLEKLAVKARCGSSRSADVLACPLAMACFVADVLLKKGPDADKDSVPDPIDQCPGTPAGAMVNPAGCWQLNGLVFETNKARIDKKYWRILKCAKAVLDKNPDLKVDIGGHTDSTGPEGFNQALSLRRAQAVKDQLVSWGVSGDRLSVAGHGSSRPFAPNDTVEHRALNRRVTLAPIR